MSKVTVEDGPIPPDASNHNFGSAHPRLRPAWLLLSIPVLLCMGGECLSVFLLTSAEVSGWRGAPGYAHAYQNARAWRLGSFVVFWMILWCGGRILRGLLRGRPGGAVEPESRFGDSPLFVSIEAENWLRRIAVNVAYSCIFGLILFGCISVLLLVLNWSGKSGFQMHPSTLFADSAELAEWLRPG